MLRTLKRGPNKDLNRSFPLQEQDESLDTFRSNLPKFTQDVEPERKMTERLLRQEAKEKQKRENLAKSNERQEKCTTTDSDISESSGYSSGFPSRIDIK